MRFGGEMKYSIHVLRLKTAREARARILVAPSTHRARASGGRVAPPFLRFDRHPFSSPLFLDLFRWRKPEACANASALPCVLILPTNAKFSIRPGRRSGLPNSFANDVALGSPHRGCLPDIEHHAIPAACVTRMFLRAHRPETAESREMENSRNPCSNKMAFELGRKRLPAFEQQYSGPIPRRLRRSSTDTG